MKKEPWARLGVNVEKDFEPLYVVPTDKKKKVTELRAALKSADELLLATYVSSGVIVISQGAAKTCWSALGFERTLASATISLLLP